MQCPAVIGLDAAFVHFVDLERALAGDERERLESLLTYGPREAGAAEAGAAGGECVSLWVVPRPGTISPWASKATDIAQVCGLAPVRRIERGIEYRLQHGAALVPADLAALAASLGIPLTTFADHPWIDLTILH